MNAITLLACVTLCYAGYNILIKLSGNHVPETATTTIVATIYLQLAAILTSLVFFAFLSIRGGQVFSLSNAAYAWAIPAGVCIGLAEIGYFYLFGGVGGGKSIAASTAIPIVLCGTILIAMVFSVIALRETVGLIQWIGCGLMIAGIALFFAGDRSGF